MFNDIPKLPGVYKFTNLKNGKIYIGKSVNLRIRMKKHKYESGVVAKFPKRTKRHVMRFYRAIAKYSFNSFKVEIIEHYPSRTPFIETLILKREEFWIRIYDATNKRIGYNILSGDQGLGHATTESTKRKISRANSGKKNGMYGKPSDSRVKICKVDTLTYQTLKIYNSLSEAGLKNQINIPHISGCLKGERIKAGKFHWDEFVDGELEKDSIIRRREYFSKRKIRKPQLWSEQQKINKSNKMKGKRIQGMKLTKVNQIDPVSGSVIKTFDAVIDAERYFNPSKKSFRIQNHLCGRTKLAYGFRWEKVSP